MAMKPFAGYNFGDYFAHWLSFDREGAQLPKIFKVNWFRKDADGKFMWPGFGDNMRVLEWMLKRVTGQVPAMETPVGNLPRPQDLNTEGLDLDEAVLAELLAMDRAGWKAEMESIAEYLDGFGERTPDALKAERARIAALLA